MSDVLIIVKVTFLIMFIKKMKMLHFLNVYFLLVACLHLSNFVSGLKVQMEDTGAALQDHSFADRDL